MIIFLAVSVSIFWVILLALLFVGWCGEKTTKPPNGRLEPQPRDTVAAPKGK